MSPPAVATPPATPFPASPPRAPVPARTPLNRRDAPSGPPLALAVRLATFAALCAFAAAHWTGLVTEFESWRVAVLTLVCTAGGAGVALVPRGVGRVRGAGAVAARLAITAAVAIVGAVTVGIPARLLGPRRWDELSEQVSGVLADIPTVNWPYSGDEDWLRLAIVLLAPLVCAAAAALAFWPARRGADLLRWASLALLVTLYGIAVTEHDFGAELGRGLLLFLLVAAFLWAPRLRRADALLGLALLGTAGALALPLAAGADRGEALVDYRSWELFGPDEGARFNWNHTYGPIDWQRDGTTLMLVEADRPIYWRAQAVDRFDGFRWLHSEAGDQVDSGFELPAKDQQREQWVAEADFTIRGFSSELVIGAGMFFIPSGVGPVSTSADGTVRPLDEPLEEGDEYSVRAYAPDPSVRMMRAAPETTDAHFLQYTEFRLPVPGESALDDGGEDRARRSVAPPTPAGTVAVPARGVPGSGTPGAAEDILDSPYARTYRLATRLALGEPTKYDVVKRIERHLRTSYDYSERPPSADVPLDAFLFEDRIGYCQQFSGAMALMLRMNGIPARVASGFTPGSYNRDTKQYRVRDLDAHSWVEVYFEDIGWVPFDPTPSASPAESQLGGSDLPSAASRPPGEPGTESGAAPTPDRAGDTGGGGGRSGDGGGLPGWFLPAGVALLALASLLVLLLARIRGRRDAPGPDARLRELRRALERLGIAVPPGTTLASLERRLAAEAGPPAARYVRRLRDERYGRVPARAPERGARRALRRALTARGGLLTRLRGYRALPPGIRPGRS